MATDRLVADTNIFIEHLRSPDKTKTILYGLGADLGIAISSVTLYELYMGANNEEKKLDIKLLTKNANIIPFDNEIAIQAAQIYLDLRKANQLIEFRDIFIAATCIVHHLPLKTINIRHFNRIDRLNFY